MIINDLNIVRIVLSEGKQIRQRAFTVIALLSRRESL
jgi:hypothetical protein